MVNSSSLHVGVHGGLCSPRPTPWQTWQSTENSTVDLVCSGPRGGLEFAAEFQLISKASIRVKGEVAR